MPFPFILPCKLLSNHDFFLPSALSDTACVMPGSQFHDINYTQLRYTFYFVPKMEKSAMEHRRLCLRLGKFISALYFFQKKTLQLERCFILKAIKESLLHPGLLTVGCLKILNNNIRRKRFGPAYFCVTEQRWDGRETIPLFIYLSTYKKTEAHNSAVRDTVSGQWICLFLG